MKRNPWFRFGVNAFSLGVEASSVITLRTLKIASGGVAAETEARRMISEKIEAGFALQAMALTGGLGLSRRRCVKDGHALPTESAGEQAPAGKGLASYLTVLSLSRSPNDVSERGQTRNATGPRMGSAGIARYYGGARG